MPNWSETMQQTFEYYTVNPITWRDEKMLTNVKSCTINRDADTETLGSATFEIDESVGECYIRVYLIAIQNGIREKFPLGTFLVQTPASSYDGRQQGFSMDAYTPLLELKESPPPLGYSLSKDANVLDYAYRLIREKARAPVIKASSETNLQTNFVANTDDTWLTFISDLVAVAKYKLALDEMGRILFAVNQDTASLQPVWTYTDDNSSILYPNISVDHDLYGIPNVVEVLYTSNNGYYYGKAVNDDSNSPTSTVSRGREIVQRVIDPDTGGNSTEEQVQQYAEQLLRELSAVEYQITYTHGYCPVRLGDCVRLNYGRANIADVKAKVISQSIKCEPGCPVTETAVFTVKLWGGVL